MSVSNGFTDSQQRAWHALELGPLWVFASNNADVVQNQVPAQALAVALEHQDWDQLATSVAACQACGLCSSRRSTVFGIGSRKARWMLVGVAPDEQEDRLGEPFVAESGQLLDAMLRAIGIGREQDVFMTNLIKCRPPGNRDPLANEMAQCAPYLQRQMQLLAPEKLVLLGSAAAQSVLGSQATIASLRGQVHQVRIGDRTVPAVVTYHPSYLLRNLEHKSRAWADWLLAKSV
jgi:uracil-DNA glycosylase